MEGKIYVSQSSNQGPLGATRMSAKSALEDHMHRLAQRLAEAEALYQEIDWDHLSQAADEALWDAFVHLRG